MSSVCVCVCACMCTRTHTFIYFRECPVDFCCSFSFFLSLVYVNFFMHVCMYVFDVCVRTHTYICMYVCVKVTYPMTSLH